MRAFNCPRILSAALLIFAMAAITKDAEAGAPAQPASAKTWNFEAQLYALVPWIQGNAELGYRRNRLIGEPVEGSLAGDVDVTPKDIVSSLNLAAMGHFEARHQSGWGVWLDYVFMDLGPDAELGDRILQIDRFGLYQGIFEGFATYRVPLDNGYLDCFGGVRWWRNSLEATATLDIPDIVHRTKSWERTIDWFDPIIGARWTHPISKKWSIRLRGDIGGFGIGSKFTSAVETGARYDITKHWRLDMRFKALWVDYAEGDVGKQNRFAYDTVSFGPILGIGYRF